MSEQSFRRILELWSSPVPQDEPPRFGWLCTWISGYPEPSAVKCDIRLRDDGLRPLIKLHQSDYPLRSQQENGVSLEWVQAQAAGATHG